MKVLVTLIYTFLFIHIVLVSQPCLPEGIIFTTQEQIDSFQVSYPGCTEIEGDVLIWGDDIVDLSGLSNIVAIHGNLNIGVQEFGNPALTSLTGLENLTYVGKELWIANNYSLESLNLESLKTIYRDFSIYNNPVLTDLSGLDNIDTVHQIFRISDNPSLLNLTNLWNLKYIGEDLNIFDNDALVSLNGLENIDNVGRDLWIWFNDAILNLDGLNGIKNCRSLIIRENNALESLEGLNNLELDSVDGIGIYKNPSLSNCNIQNICDFLAAPNGSVNIFNNAEGCNNPPEIAYNCGITLPCLPYGNYLFHNQEDIDGFQENYPGCTELKGYVIIEGDSINNLNGLNVITEIDGNLDIKSNPVLTNLSGLDNLTLITGNLSIWQNDIMLNMEGLDNLTTIQGYLWISYNDILHNLAGLQSLSYVGNSLNITYNNAISTLQGLSSFHSTGTSLWISDNNNLLNLSGLDQLFNIKGSFILKNNPAIGDLLNLNNLVSISEDLHIENNNSLTSLSGLENVCNSSLEELYILNNESLSFCAVESICSYLIGTNVEIEISDNANGCSNKQEVETACDSVGISQHLIDLKFSVYPNPTKDWLNIKHSDLNITFSSELRNLYGQLVKKVKNIQSSHYALNMADLKSGIYFYVIREEDKVLQQGKVVVK